MEEHLWMPYYPNTRVHNVVIRPSWWASVSLSISIYGGDVCVNVVHPLHHLVYQAYVGGDILKISTPVIFVEDMEDKAHRFYAGVSRDQWGIIDVIVAARRRKARNEIATVN